MTTYWWRCSQVKIMKYSKQISFITRSERGPPFFKKKKLQQQQQQQQQQVINNTCDHLREIRDAHFRSAHIISNTTRHDTTVHVRGFFPFFFFEPFY